MATYAKKMENEEVYRSPVNANLAENKELHRQPINDYIKRVVVEDETLRIEPKKASPLSLRYQHSQDCCEHVYADFDAMKPYISDIEGKQFKELVIKGVDGMGFLLCLYSDWDSDENVKAFIPCYNNQNGYYSDELKLIINDGQRNVDIEDLAERNGH